jgi:putative membrane protein
MGATEVIHGVSASTMALMLGVYQEFILSLRSLNTENVRLWKRKGFRIFWTEIHGPFLVSLFLGILTGLFFVTRLVSELLQEYFIVFTSFLFGLVLISGILLLRKIRKWTPGSIVMFFCGIAINYFLSAAPPLTTADNPLFALLAGVCAGFSLALPGISSAFILILIGKYQYIVLSFSELNLLVTILFFVGCLVGLWMASRFMYRIFAEYYNVTVALLAGLMLGALNKLWPWRNVFEYATNSKGDQIPAYDTSILPWKYMALTGKDPEVFLVVLIEKITAGLKTKI